MRIINGINSKHKADIYFFLVLILCGFKYTYGLENILDIGLYDESLYLYRGYFLSENGFPHAENAPLYAVWYYILSIFQSDRVELYYLNYKILSAALPIILFFLLRRYRLQQLSSFIVSFIFMISYANLPLWPKVSNFATLIILSFLLIASYAKNNFSYFAIVSFGALLGSYIRPELFISFVLFLLFYVGFFVIRFKKFGVSNIIFLAVLVLLSVALLGFWGLPIDSEGRSLDAFKQHFSLNWVQWTGSQLSPWTNAEEIFIQNFGEADSYFETVANNPSMLMKHIGYNIKKISRNGIGIFFVHSNVLIPRDFQIIEAILLLLLFMTYCFFNMSRLKCNGVDRINSQNHLLLPAAFFLFPTLISALLIYPRCNYQAMKIK